MDHPAEPIDAVARQTGLSAHVIRIWEKRYGAVEPARTASNRRLYAPADIERLKLLRDLTHAGRSIGSVARLSTEQLRRLMADSEPTGTSASGGSPPVADVSGTLDAALEAVRAMDERALVRTLQRADVALGTHGMLLRLAAPLAHALGSLWRDGSITAAHEHFATAILRTYLSQSTRTMAPSATGPGLLVSTPSGQLHEIGALLAAAVAGNLGWSVTYLGASLPAAEIAGAAQQRRVRAVALSLVYPEDDPHLGGELRRLRELLAPDVALLAGGRAIAAYQPALEQAGATIVPTLGDLGRALDQLRRTSPGSDA